MGSIQGKLCSHGYMWAVDSENCILVKDKIICAHFLIFLNSYVKKNHSIMLLHCVYHSLIVSALIQIPLVVVSFGLDSQIKYLCSPKYPYLCPEYFHICDFQQDSDLF